MAKNFIIASLQHIPKFHSADKKKITISLLIPNSWCQHLPNVVYFQDIICRLLAWPWPALSHPVICAGRAGRGMRARVRLMIPIIRQKPLFIHHCGSCDPQATTQQTANIPFAPRCSHLNPFTCERVSYEDSLSRCRKWQKVSAMSLLVLHRYILPLWKPCCKLQSLVINITSSTEQHFLHPDCAEKSAGSTLCAGQMFRLQH